MFSSSLSCEHKHNLRDRLAGERQTDFFFTHTTIEELIFIK